MPDTHSSPRVRARSMLFDLYGDFALEGGRPGVIRLSALAQLATSLGVSGGAARVAVARMVRDGWLRVDERDRERLVELTGRGRELVEQGRERIFSHPNGRWDGTWLLVALSVPESRREIRDRMRKQLAWLGFGSPSSALYISPRDHRAAVERVARDLGAVEYVQLYRGELLQPIDPLELVARAWSHLDEVNLRYAGFLNRFSREFTRVRAATEEGTLRDDEAFRTRFTLVSAFRRCLFGDPELPAELLPAAWWGAAARQTFLEFHALVTPPALRYFDEVARRSDST